MMLSKIKPHAIQQEALRALRKARNISKLSKALNVMPSGIGKTHLAAFDTKKAKAKRILYIAHRREILEQAERIFKDVYGYDQKDNTQTGFIMGSRKEFNKPITFATIQTLSRSPNLEQISKIPFDYTIIDEYHHVAANTYLHTLDSLQTRFLLGLTATPYRLDGKDIMHTIDHNLTYSMELETGIERRELVPFYYHVLHDNIDYSDIRWQGYRYKENDLNKKLIIDRRDNQIIEEYEKSIQPTGRRTMMFCVSVKHADRMASKLQKRGIRARALTHHTPIPERRMIVDDFRAGLFDVLCVRDIFNEGIDFPEVSAIMFLRPTFSRTVFFQQLGRGLRKSPEIGKNDVIVFDFVSNYHNAYKITEWLSSAQQTNEHVREQKPEYHHAVSLVYFDKEVINIFELQSKRAKFFTHMGEITKEKLIEEYKRIASAVGFNPRMKQMVDREAFRRKYNVFPKYSMKSYIIHFKGWTNFCQTAGLNFFKYPRYFWRSPKSSIPDMIQNYWEVKAKAIAEHPELDNAKRITSIIYQQYITDSKISRYHNSAYVHHFGTWYKFLVHINDAEHAPKSARDYNLEWVKIHYNKLADKLARRYISEKDWREEYHKQGTTVIRNKIGSFDNLRRLMNDGKDPQLIKICAWCKKEYAARLNLKGESRFCTRKCNNDYKYYNPIDGLRLLKLNRSRICEICAKEYKMNINPSISDRLPTHPSPTCSEACKKIRALKLYRIASRKRSLRDDTRVNK